MGCRGQIAVKQGEHKVYMYTHWTGDSVERILRGALNRGRDLWNDEEYLTRIIFCDLVGNDNGTTGFGIGLLAHSDIEYPIPIVNPEDQTITFENDSSRGKEYKISFSDFVNS